jgi:hypothetical protein
LAQRQGLLVGRHLSDVQFNAVTILDWIDRMDTAKKSAEAELLTLRAALVSRADDDFRPENLFKDWFPTPTDEVGDDSSLDVETEQGKLGIDYSEVEFKGREAIEEYEELMRQIGSLTTGSVTGSDVQSVSLGSGGWI